jgi:hypothetical protein
MDTTNALASVDQLLALRMHLMCALTADKCGKDDVAYDMVSQAFVLYEDEISDSKQQVELVTVFTGTLRSLSRSSSELCDPPAHPHWSYVTLWTVTTRWFRRQRSTVLSS